MATVKYMCADCYESLVPCDRCGFYIHLSRWLEHSAKAGCASHGIGTCCAQDEISIRHAVEHAVHFIAVCSFALLLTWLLWAQVVEAWDTSYRAGWLH
jgi:hypothetical protein